MKTNIDQDAASLGAAAIAACGSGLWDSYDIIESLHKVESIANPVKENNDKYEALFEVFQAWSDSLADLGDKMRQLQAKGIW